MVQELAQTGNEFTAMSLHLGLAVSALKEATDWLYTNAPNDPNAAPAGATPYLRMFSTIVGGYLLAKSALKAKNLLAAGDSDKGFLSAKIITANFFVAQIMPQATALLGPVTEGADTLFAITEEQLSA